MKKMIFTLLVLMVSVTGIQAQSLYDTVYKRATAVVNNPKSSDEEININQFKITALNYMSNQIKKRGLEKDSYFYDSQAVNLASFVTDFQANLAKAPAAKRTEVLKIYQDACKNNPMFKDNDKSTINCYVEDKLSPTPFCIDTNWEKAYDQATTQIKQALK